MNPKIGVAIVAHNQTQTGLRQVVDDARRAGSAVKASANDMTRSTQSAAMHTANLGAQFNDIAVQLAQPGTSPFLIAMQQGTQISQIIGPMGAGGAVKALGSAFMGLLNPVSLVTIGTIALAGSVVQWLASLNAESPKAEDHLKAHTEWLDKILSGYDQARSAADGYIAEMDRLPQGVVRSEVGSNLQRQRQLIADQAETVAQLNAQVADYVALLASSGDMLTQQLGASDDDIARLAAFVAETDALNISTTTSVEQLGALQARATELMNTVDDPAIVGFAQAIYDWADALRISRAEAAGLAAVIGSLSFPAVPESFTDALDALGRLAPAKLSDRDQALAALNEGLGSAQDEIQRIALRAQYDDALKRIAAEEAAVAAKKAASASLGGGGMTDLERSRLDLDKFNDTLSDTAKRTAELGQTVASGLTTATTAFFGAIIKGDDALQALRNSLANIAQQLLNSSLSSLFSTVTGNLFGTGTWNIPTSHVPGGFYPGLPNANGGVFSGPGIGAFSGSVVSSPTLFPFARGVGLMGEAGPEAILPLKRGSDGKLGVSAGGGRVPNVVFNVRNEVSGAQVDQPKVSIGAAGEVIVDMAVRKVERKMAEGGYRSYGVGPGVKKT